MDGQSDGQYGRTELLYQYPASVCLRAIKSRGEWIMNETQAEVRMLSCLTPEHVFIHRSLCALVRDGVE